MSLVAVGGASRTMEVVATAGDLNLGGDDFTRAVAAAARVDFDEAERAKVRLTTRKVTDAGEGEAVSRVSLENGPFLPLLERLCDAAREACYLGDARLRGDDDLAPAAEKAGNTRAKRRKAARADKRALDDLRKSAPGVKIRTAPGAAYVDDLVLVGAATKMPCVQRTLARLCDVPLRKTVDPDAAVAFGAALKARANDAAAAAPDDFVVVDSFQAEAPAAAPKSPFSAVAASAQYPRPRHGVAATRLHGMSPQVLRHFAGNAGGGGPDAPDDVDEAADDLDDLDDAEFERLLALAEAEDDDVEEVEIDEEELTRLLGLADDAD